MCAKQNDMVTTTTIKWTTWPWPLPVILAVLRVIIVDDESNDVSGWAGVVVAVLILPSTTTEGAAVVVVVGDDVAVSTPTTTENDVGDSVDIEAGVVDDDTDDEDGVGTGSVGQ